MSEAYKWLQSLPPSIKDEMKSMEQVMSLYLRAKRLGGAIPSREDLGQFPPPAPKENVKSAQDFQKTLKNLSQELEFFDAPQTPTPKPAQAQPSAQPTTHQENPILKLDPKSRGLIHDIKEGFNLSSDVEVI